MSSLIELQNFDFEILRNSNAEAYCPLSLNFIVLSFFSSFFEFKVCECVCSREKEREITWRGKIYIGMGYLPFFIIIFLFKNTLCHVSAFFKCSLFLYLSPPSPSHRVCYVLFERLLRDVLCHKAVVFNPFSFAVP